jgi:hypothetical protein
LLPQFALHRNRKTNLTLILFYSTAAASVMNTNFTMGDESAHYQVSYATVDAIKVTDELADNGFIGTGPFPFVTTDNDTTGCAANQGAAGWYAPGSCTSQSLFADPLAWYLKGSKKTVQNAILGLIREKPFY